MATEITEFEPILPVLRENRFDFLLGHDAARQYVGPSDGAAISMITWMEVAVGAASPDEEVVLRAFLATRATSSFFPAMMPACGPPSSLSPEKVTRSAPSANASLTVGSDLRP